MQPIEVWNLIQETGVYRCDPAKSWLIEMGFQEKYRWLCDKMKERVGDPPEGVELPVWAWYMQNGKHSKPDLRSERWGYGPGNEQYACIELEIPDDQVLLSDFDTWHCVLNGWLISYTEKEDNRIHEYYDRLSSGEQQRYMEQNWERVFDISLRDNHWTKCGSWVQATFWELRKDMIRNVRFFITGKYKERKANHEEESKSGNPGS